MPITGDMNAQPMQSQFGNTQPQGPDVTDSLSYEDYLEQQEQQSGQGDPNLDQDAFLQILMTQLQNQDPLDPMDDKEFVAQMAQFSSMEQMISMNETLTDFVASQEQQQFVSHSDLIGKQVEWERPLTNEEKEEGLSEEEVHLEKNSGLVTAVKFKDGNATLVIDDEKELSTEDILSVQEPAAETAANENQL
ncbi:flagellar hook assembly protein FlgD [Salisediminibacterium halotolerans]|uniref:Flagellar basal-body rod modification protein FlgD n=1 Tax=Salisediminibacterium halotolerans TaxID=517425 RepID=A0A1H9Q433_9BACI|nr:MULTISPECIES: flagellar hook assembly protein FlgD [Salisediminibacterium]RLJ74216.1 flagellar basal-body rod modification protein FlgD [Actinophytocola xinjiangensis]RPE87691.1 flagellar basal-body rod modification protein FlgD [Salisediminibacterium halotolerans]TWG35053.1 flagellar basal-body rod modification protein FlgD [Salisediminibacterium halotolerans]SER55211.1 flagellar basal-body rod modification protein FlgD [Salisediminibacterium haloalkalitolerans]GEL06660.1 hypothetical prot